MYFGSAIPEMRRDDPGPLASKDVDLYGLLDAVRTLARRLNGRVRRPDPDDATLNAAVVELELNGRKALIDVLASVLGVPEKNVRDDSVLLDVLFELDGRKELITVRLLHPLDCLRSRVSNLLSPATRRRDPVSLRQARIAVRILEAFLKNGLAEGDKRKVHQTLRNLAGYLRSDLEGKTLPGAIRAFMPRFPDPLRILIRASRYPELDVRIREKTIKPRIKAIEEWRKGERAPAKARLARTLGKPQKHRTRSITAP